MPQPIDPAIETESLEQLKDSLAKFKRANKAQKQRLGGSRYKRQLETNIASLETALLERDGPIQEPPISIGSNNEREQSEGPALDRSTVDSDDTARRQPALDDMDIDDEPKSIEMLVEMLPYIPLEKFKTAWNTFRADGQSTGPTEALQTAWQALQTVAALSCQALGIPRGDPAWPGPAVGSANRTMVCIMTTAKWLSERIPSFEADNTLRSGPVKEKLFYVWDHAKHEYIEMTDTRLLEARTDPSAHIGCIEEGLELVLRILTNRNKNQKCLSCEAGGRGQSTSTKGQALRGDGAGFLNKCRCPIDTAVTEFWMYKATADDPQVPRRDDPDISSSDFMLNPVLLRLIGAAIKAASGLTPETLFDQRRDRLATTILWGMDEIAAGCIKEEQLSKLRVVKSRFEKVMNAVRELDSSEDEGGN